MTNKTEYPEFPKIDGVEFRILKYGFGHAASSDGRIWSCLGIADEWVERKVKPDKVGRLRYCFLVDGKKIYKRGNMLIAEAFLGPIPEGMVVAHYPDRNPANNSVSNLKIVTQLENVQHAIEHGTQVRGENVYGSLLTEDLVRKIRQLAQTKMPIRAMARQTGIDRTTLKCVIDGKTWKHVT